MEKNKEISIVIPSYHEEDNLRVLLPRLKTSLDLTNLQYEILIIDTEKSMDNTNVLCKELGVHYINRENGNFYGNAVRLGISKASGNYILFMDADGSHPPEFIQNLINCRSAGDLIIASRYVQGGGSDNSALLRLMSRTVNIVFSIVLQLKCKDVSNSFKLYKADRLKSLSLSCNNFDIVEEILVKLIRNDPNLRIVEIPFFFRERMFGHTKRNLFVFIFSYFFTLIKLRSIK